MAMINKVQKISCVSHRDALKALCAELNARTFKPSEYYVVLCPDRYTQSVEQALFGRGAMDCEVLTLSRLSYRVSKTAPLSSEGAVMITARAIAEAEPELEYYGRAAAYPDFASEAYKTLQQIASSDVKIEDIAASGSVKLKLNDLARIQNAYTRIKGEYSDAPDKLYSLIAHAGASKLVTGSHFYAIGYSDMTKLNRRVFSALAAYAKSFTLYEAETTEKKRDELTLLTARDRVSEYKQLAAEIRDHVHRGGDYGDIAVLCDAPRVIKRIFREYGIPVYTDETTALFDSPPLVALQYIYRLNYVMRRRGAVDRSALEALIKNPFAGVDCEDAERLLFEAQTFALDHIAPDHEFKSEGARRAFGRVRDILRVFAAGNTFAGAVEKTAEFCDFAGVWSGIKEQGTDPVTPVFGLTELLGRYGAGEFDTDARAFFAAAQTVNVNTLPRERDCVTITSAQALRLSSVEILMIPDFNEGALPAVTADTGLISDRELIELGGAIEPTVRDRNRQARDELRSAVLGAKTVIAAYAESEGRAAAFIKELALGIVRTDCDEIEDVLYGTHDKRLIGKYACTPAAARELAARRLTRHRASLDAVTDRSECVAAGFWGSVGNVDKSAISVSELSHWFKCPYYRFLKDAVGITERRSGFGAPDFGIVVHDFMRRFVAHKPLDTSESAVKLLLDEALEQSELKPDAAAYSRMLADAVDYAVVNAHILNSGEYEVGDVEQRFGGGYFGREHKLEFIGYIDRFDVCGKNARVIDYKTGNKKFDISACYDGTDMQLPLYASVLPQRVTGMFYIRQCGRYNTGKPERAMSGCMIADPDVVLEYDTALYPGGPQSDIVPAKLGTDKKTGKTILSGRRTKATLDEAEFDSLIAACKANADTAVDEIMTGYIDRAPVEGACEYCAFRGVCGDGVVPRGTPSAEDDE